MVWPYKKSWLIKSLNEVPQKDGEETGQENEMDKKIERRGPKEK